MPYQSFPWEVEYGIQKFCKGSGQRFVCRDPVSVSGSNAFGSGRRSVSGHQLYLYLPFLLLGISLLLARAGVLPDTWYRWYKLLNAPFLQLCNLCSADVTASSLSWGKTVFLAVWNLLPPAVVWVTYALARSGFLPEELQYQRKKSFRS